jgi:endonuclease III
MAMSTDNTSSLPRKISSIIVDEVVRLYGGQKIELDYETPFQLLCAVILSAQTTDKQVNRVTPPFFAKVKEARDVINLSLEDIMEDLRYVNFYRNKSRYIKETGTILATEYEWVLPDDLDLIQTFPGIGVKTAKVVLSVLYDRALVGVDTHIHRVMNRIGFVETKTPNETDKKIDQIFDIETKKKLHHPFVLFGRYQCTARAPKCTTCTIAKYCKYKKSLKKWGK